MNKLQAGFARVNVNPMMGIELMGYFFSRPADGVLDDIEINALALACGEEKAVIFSLIAHLRKSQHTELSRLDGYRIKAQFGIIISYILERINAFDSDERPENVPKINLYTKIENYFYLNYSQQITLNSLADYFSYSRTQMRRILNKCFAKSFTQKLREIRINAAKQYLKSNDMSIDTIAKKRGYEIRQGFETMFLKYVGITPNQFRRAEKQQK